MLILTTISSSSPPSCFQTTGVDHPLQVFGQTALGFYVAHLYFYGLVGYAWTENLALGLKMQERIRAVIRENTTPRHVPAKIVAVPEIPRTKSGKIVELAVRSIVHGKPVKNTDALANPEALAHFANLAELATDKDS